MANFVMPKLGADMTTGKLLAWRKSPGDTVERGEVIAEIETDKSDIEVESFVTGVIVKILVQPGEKVPVGTVLAIIREEGEGAEAEMTAETTAASFPPSLLPPATPLPVPEVESKRLRISPAAKKRAEEFGIDPATIAGTGPQGRITSEDVERAAAARTTQKPDLEAAVDRQARMRQAIASAMAKSKREIPHYYLSNMIDITRALEWLAEENKSR